MPERPTFSPFWHRVRSMCPHLRPHVQITRQHYRGRRWHVAHDPATNQFYRLNPIAHEFIGLLDGRRTVDETWKLILARHGDAAPTQIEVIQLLSQMYNANLLSADVTPETEQLLRRGRERLKKKVQQQAIGIMYFRMRIFNPDRLFAWLEPLMRPVLNRWGFLAWLAFLVVTLYFLLPEFDRLVSGVDSVINPANWGWLIVVFIVTKAIHETGHGVICKRFGGQVPEFGMMLLVLFPAPYVDASSCWAFPSKWQRIAVGAGGMIFELFTASIAAWIWLNTREGLVHQIAYNAIFTASISTLLFNANPLMRFDGYYILSDLLEVPNLMSRSMNMIKYLFQKHMYRIKDAKPPSTVPAERAILVTYGLAALAYRVFLFISITLYVMGKLFAIGLILAIWTAAAWFILPIGKFTHWLATNPQLAEFRLRAIVTSIVAIGLVAGLLGRFPMPDHRRGAGVVESVRREGVFFRTNGFVTEAHVRAGTRVRAGDPILTCRSNDLESRIRIVEAQLAEYTSIEQVATSRNPAEAQIARERLNTQKELLEHLLARQDELIVVAPFDGVVVGGDPAEFVGRYATRGQPICEVVDDENVRIAASMTQAEAGWLNELNREEYEVQIRSVAAPARTLHGGDVRVIEAGQLELPHAALGFLGGGAVETAPDDRRGLLARDPIFTVYVTSDVDHLGVPGQRVKLRFTLPDKPLVSQWADRLHKMIQGRVKL